MVKYAKEMSLTVMQKWDWKAPNYVLTDTIIS